MIMNKMEIRAMALSVATFCAFACAKETVDNTGNGGDSLQRHHITINATADSEDHEDASTKVIFPGNIKSATIMYWQKDDQIGVQASGSESLYPLSVESRSTNLQSAVFAGDIEGTLGGYAVYPYNEGHKISGSTLTYHLPSEYNIIGFDTDWVENSDKIDDSKAKANFALLAKITENQSGGGASTQFKHLGGLLCIKIDKMPSSSCTLTITADKKICGDFSVNLASSSPEIESDEDSSTDNVVTVNSGATYNESCVYYIPMPVGEYNLTVKLSYSLVSGKLNASCTSTKSVEIERAKIVRVGITKSTMHKGGYQIIDNYKFIDLGLPSGVLWAETNVGATLPADFGNFYAWGETAEREASSDGYKYYDVGSYKFYKETKENIEVFSEYNSGGDLLTLKTSDDAAYMNWTTRCWTPTKEQAQELIDNTTYTRTSRTNSKGRSVDGFEFKSKTNDNSIFLPYNGEYVDAKHDWADDGGGHTYYYGCYWTNNLEPEVLKDYLVYATYKYIQAECLLFGNEIIDEKTNADVEVRTEERYYGMGVRPVANPN